jgi:single-strand DNA-binding protein
LEDAEYHRCVSYGKWAEVLWKYLVKWKRVYIEWRLRTRKWQDTEWNDKYSTEVIVDNFIFLDSRWSWEDNTDTNAGNLPEENKSDDLEEKNVSNPEDDEEVPF